MSEEKTNAKQFPKIFYARHMQPGLVGYHNETIMVDGDTLKDMIPSFVGRPVYMGHRNVDLENIKAEANGYVTESFYNELDGWAWLKFLAIDDDVYQANAKGWAVSNAYIPTEWGPGGMQNNCPYDRKIVGGEFTHLAIVADPRYEEACILTPDEFKIYQTNKRAQLNELQNSKEKVPFMKFFKNKKEEVSTVDADTMVEIQNEKGETVSVSIKEMTDAVLNAKAKKNEADEDCKKEKMNENTSVTVGDETMPMSELMNRYSAAMKNEADEDEKKNAEDDKEKEDKEKENASDEDKKDDDEKKENSKGEKEKTAVDHFEELRNAHAKNPGVRVIETSQDKVARGRSLYGSAQ